MIVVRDRVVARGGPERLVREAVREGGRDRGTSSDSDTHFTRVQKYVRMRPVHPDDAFRSPRPRAWLEAHAPAMRARLDAGDDRPRALRCRPRVATRAVRRRLGRHRLARRVRRPGRHARAGRDLRRGAGRVRGERRLRRVDDRHGRPGAAAPRHRRAAGALPAAAAARRRDVVPAVQRAGGGQRPREPRDTRRCATATSSSSTGRRSGRRTRTCATSRSCSRARTPTRRSIAGITFFLVDLRTPGIEVRPLRQITGAAHFNEVFLTDVRVPVENVVGEIDDGWAPARAVLAHEASVIGGGNAAAHGLRDAGRARARRSARRRRADHAPAPRATRTRAKQILRYMKERVQASVRAGGRPAIDGSVMKVLWSEARRERAELGVALLGAGRRALRRVADPAARAVLGHDRRRDERGAPNDDRRAGARAPAGAAGRPRRVVPRAGGAPCLTSRSRTASTTNPIRCAASRTACACSRASPTAGRAGRSPTSASRPVGTAATSARAPGRSRRGWPNRSGATGRVVSLDVDTRFQPPSAGVIEVRTLDVTTRADRRRTSSTSCTRAACCNTSRSGKRCSTR